MLNPKDRVSEKEQGYIRQANEFMQSEAYKQERHPDHFKMVRQVRRYLTAAYGDTKEKNAEILRPSAEERFHGVKKLEY